jgi:acyl carrier protein
VNPSQSFVIRTVLRKDQTMPTASEIDAKITKVLVHALGVEEDDIKPSATLQGDLGAESIDFLDIVFRLEREFMIKIDQDELFPGSFLAGDSGIIDEGRLTDVGLAALHSRMPYADWRTLEHDRRLDRIDDLFTVDLVTSYVQWKLAKNGAAKTDVHAPAILLSDESTRFVAVSTESTAA